MGSQILDPFVRSPLSLAKCAPNQVQQIPGVRLKHPHDKRVSADVMKRSCTPCIGMTIQVHILHTGKKRISHATEFLVTHTGMSRKMAPMGKKKTWTKQGRQERMHPW